jgi:hypothetical protein
MNAVLVNMGRGTGIVLGLLLATATYGQAPTPAPILKPVLVEKPKTPLNPTGAAHRMEIQSGTIVGVRYFGKDLGPSEMVALRDLERAENEASYGDSLAALRQMYVRNELEMEARRHNVQLALYGNSTTVTSGGGWGGGAYATPAAYDMGYAALPNGLSLVQNGYGYGGGAMVYPGQYAFNRLYPNVYTPGYWGDANFGGIATSVTSVDSLQNGMGDEGVMKNEIAKAIAARYSPETMATTYRNLDNAVFRIAYMPKVRDALNGPEPGRVVPVATPGAITLTLKDVKEPLKGNLVGVDGDWLIVQTDTEEVRVRKEDVVKSASPLKK